MNREFAKYSDDELLPMLRGGKPEAEAAFTEFYNRYASKVHAYCLCMINDTLQAEDIFQETFIKFFNKIDPGYAHTNVSSYLMTIARNLCLNYIRTKRPTLPIETIEHIETESYAYESAELFELVMKSLELLDEKYREAFIMREFDGMHYQQIAEITGTSISNAKSRVTRARQKIIDILGPYLNDAIK